MINLRKTLEVASGCLTSHGINHALIGGFALAAHGINRATADIDFLADGQKRDLIISSLQTVAFKLVNKTDDVLQFEGVGNLDILLANRPLSRQMLASSKQVNGLPIRVLLVEDIIGLKIQAYKNDSSRELQDKADIQALTHKYICGLVWRVGCIEKPGRHKMTFNEYLEFLKQYWDLFGPPPPRPLKKAFKISLL